MLLSKGKETMLFLCFSDNLKRSCFCYDKHNLKRLRSVWWGQTAKNCTVEEIFFVCTSHIAPARGKIFSLYFPITISNFLQNLYPDFGANDARRPQIIVDAAERFVQSL